MRLKPCPFCGKGDLKNEDYPGVFTVAGHWVECRTCGTTGPEGFNRESSEKKWNDRACQK